MSMIDYPHLVLGALRHAIAGLLRQVAEEGLPGDHHFFITFRTDAPGVELPASLHRQHPDEMTIVLQHQFRDLTADADGFAVTLSFGGAPARLRVPYTAMTAFADPSVDFGLQLAVPQAPLEGAESAETPAGSKAAPLATVIAFPRNGRRDPS